ncbi:large conductance mechanosensitive channel protein MscL [Parafrigoribacterium mesophilum]|uniref:large conductance mechanosensitive channel protein MscL n=1 Tax=Parafrigoribacterium mesophilum TaxID=433646 RepID=UPI0031FCFA51
MIKGFKEFILRGNVIDLAVAFVIGVAFAAVVTAFVEKIINPLIGALFSADSLDNSLVLHVGSASLQFGALIGAIIQFLLIALVVYFALVVPMNYLRRLSFRRRGAQPEADTPPSELDLLTQIRDLLATPAGADAGNSRHAADV